MLCHVGHNASIFLRGKGKVWAAAGCVRSKREWLCLIGNPEVHDGGKLWVDLLEGVKEVFGPALSDRGKPCVHEDWSKGFREYEPHDLGRPMVGLGGDQVVGVDTQCGAMVI